MQPEKKASKNFRTNQSVGDILRRARMEKNLSVQDIEQATRISAQHIVAIEEERYEVLPGRIYALNFIKTYAEYVELDGDRILGLLKKQSGEKVEFKETPAAPAPELDDNGVPSVQVFALILILFLGLIGYKNFVADPVYLANGDIPEVPKDLKNQTTLLAKPEAKKIEPKEDNTQVAIPEPTPPQNQIVLKAIANVWIEIRDSERKTLFSRVLSSGEEYWIPLDLKGLSMTLGNAGGLQISIDGQALPLFGRTGQVIRKLSLDPEKLKEVLKTDNKKAM